MWSEKYRPTTVGEVIGNDAAKIEFISWLDSWKPGKKAALLHGPPGIGKTTLVQVTAKTFSFDLVEMNASDSRTEEKIMRVAGHATSEVSIFNFISVSKGTLLLLDEVDGIHGRADQGGLGAILRLIREAKTPIALVANDISDLRLRDLRNACQRIRFYQIRPPILVALLKEICRKEGITAEEEALRLIASRCEGDVRSAINDLQSVAEKSKSVRAIDFENLTVRDKQLSIHETLRNIFLAESPLQARKAQSRAEVDYEMLHQTIHDNLPLQYTDPEELAAGYDSLSHADVFLGRIKRTRNWGLLRYALEQMSVGVAAARRRKYRPASYRFPPSKLVLLSRLRSQRKLRNDICSSIGAECHVSKYRANRDFLPFLQVIFKNNEKMASGMVKWLNLTREMVAYLSETPLVKKQAPRRRRGGRQVKKA